MSTTGSTKGGGLYQLRLEIGTGDPGAPMFHFDGLVSVPADAITGQVEITQVTAPPFRDYKVQVHGRRVGMDPPSVAFLHGQYVVSVPPPAIGSFLAHLEIVIVFHDSSWNGTADITYAGGHLKQVPVKSVS